MMPKRFRDTGLWDKDWYVALTCAERCAFDYALSRCDAVGVWAPAPELANRIIGEKVDWEVLPGKTNKNIKMLENGKWWFVDFCKFQYGNIKRVTDSKVQKHLCSLLDEYGLWDAYRATVASTVASTVGNTVQDKEEEKEEEKDSSSGKRVREKPKVQFSFETGKFRGISDEHVSRWCDAYPALEIETELAKAAAWLQANPAKRKKNYQRFLVNWLSRSQERGGDRVPVRR
jgi:hypothetical protein